jgi:hypothetical protein
MKKQIGDIERKRRKYKKMLKSLSNKMQGSNEIWWNSLSQKAQYAVLFRLIQAKQDPKYKFKHFICNYKPKFRPLMVNARNAAIDHLIEE